MKITSIETNSILHAYAVKAENMKPVTLFCGDNMAGKSSLCRAIRQAFTGEMAATMKKADYKLYLSDNGAKEGFATVLMADGEEYSIVLPQGKGAHNDSPFLPFVLDPPRFAATDLKTRAAMLFDLAGVKRDGPAVKRRLLAEKAPEGESWKGWKCDPKKVEQIMPMLRAGFDSAVDEAKAKATEAKRTFKSTTNTTWGADKGANWKAETKETFSKEQIAEAEAAFSASDASLEAENQRVGALKEAARSRAATAARIAALRDSASKVESIKANIARYEGEHTEWLAKLAALPERGGKQPTLLGCPCCGGALMQDADGTLKPYETHAVGQVDMEVEETRAKYQKAADLQASTVSNSKRDLVAAEAAAVEIKTLSEGLDPNAQEPDLPSLDARLAALRETRNLRQSAVNSMYDANKAYQSALEATAAAAVAHTDVIQWLEIAEALSPAGIPADMMGAALTPFRERMAESCEIAEWPLVEIDNELNIRIGGRPYREDFSSESERWRADAVIAEAISHLSGLRVLALDRFDLLDLKSRGNLFYWLECLEADGGIDSVMLFGTLKAIPAALPPCFDAVWIENGTAGGMQEAA